MKADLLLLYSLLAIAALFAYVFVGGLVVRAVEVSGWDMKWSECGYEHSCRPIAFALWPLTLIALTLIGGSFAAYRLSQWRPRRKSTLPGARVVRP